MGVLREGIKERAERRKAFAGPYLLILTRMRAAIAHDMALHTAQHQQRANKQTPACQHKPWRIKRHSMALNLDYREKRMVLGNTYPSLHSMRGNDNNRTYVWCVPMLKCQ